MSREVNANPAIAGVAERIRSGKRFLITAHRNPDGDAIGSALALQGVIRILGKTAEVIVRDDFSIPLRKLPGTEGVTIADTLPADYPKGFDALFTMECPEHERTGFPVLPGPVINIDHHLGNRMYGEVNYLDTEAPSVGEMVMWIARELNVPLDRDMATAIYVSLASDTGFFRYTNTTLRAFEAAGELVRAGAEPGEISLWLNESNTFGAIKLLGLCLSTIEITNRGTIATIDLPQQFFVDAGAMPEDTEGIVNYGRSIDGVLVSALFKENVDGCRVSLRAKPGVDVQKVAAMFGGGGHAAASGCFVPLPLHEARQKIVTILADVIG